MTSRSIVAIGLLTEDELARLGPAFSRAWPIDSAPCFTGLLEAIDDAERELWRKRDAIEAAALSAEDPFDRSDGT